MNIAVLHHLSTKERRVKCINELKRVCKTKGKIIITVWSWEFYKNKYENKDAFVDWPLHKRFTETGNKDELYTRYYHFFEKNEIINLIKNINNLNIVDIYFEHENWIIILEKI
jgi:predicted SAM-dependent methyltransferase